MKKISLLTLLCALFALTACEKEPTAPEQNQPIAVVGITIDEPTRTITLAITASRALRAIVTPEDATDKGVVWSSDDATIAAVSPEGIVTAVKAGITTIRATSSAEASVSDECTVIVETPTIDVTQVLLDLKTLEVEIDQTKPLVVTITPENATNRSVSWDSSDPAVATVSKTGAVTGVKIGKATITVRSEANNEKFATCEVSVTQKSIPATDMWMKTPKLDLKIGEVKLLDAVPIPTNTTVQTIVWSSDDPTVATVDNKGLVTSIKAGTTTIWAKWGSDNSIKDKCLVTVLGNSSYLVGDLYPDAKTPMGVVFWKDPADPAKGKIVSLSETIVAWGEEGIERNVSDEKDGTANMAKIRTIPGWETLYPAFKWCADKGSGWYLPAIAEMKAIYDARDAINASIAKITTAQATQLDYSRNYWTSTERALSPQSSAAMIQFYEGFGGGSVPPGGTGYSSKGTTNNTRAVIKF